MTWLLILMIGGGTGNVKYVEFPTKQTCEAAVAAINDKSGIGWRVVCVEGGKPIPETRGVAPAPEKQ
jgi:hypothetical protein